MTTLPCFAAPAWANDQQKPETPPDLGDPAAQQPANPVTPSAPVENAVTANAATEAPGDDEDAELARLAEIDKLRGQGRTTNLPGSVDSILGDTGGIRSRLADKGIWFQMTNSSSASINALGGRRPLNPQRYSGQKLTASNTAAPQVSFKIAGQGEDLLQINTLLNIDVSTWPQSSPRGVAIGRFDLYGRFFDGKVEINAGINTNLSNFIGIFAGGNPLLASGLAGTIPVQVGLSANTGPTPTFNVQLNGANGLYSKTGIQRSLLPAGLVAEADTNGIGLKITRKGAKPLIIQEFGILRPASKEGRQMWLRAGFLHNETRYQRFDGQGSRKNWMLYALADYQIVKPSVTEPYRGVFLGASVLAAPSSINVYKRTYEGRIYAVGMVPGRHSDAMTLTVAYNDFSKTAGRNLATPEQPTQPYQFSVGMVYAAHISRGIYLAPSVTYLKNPSFTGDFKPALNFGLASTLIF